MMHHPIQQSMIRKRTSKSFESIVGDKAEQSVIRHSDEPVVDRMNVDEMQPQPLSTSGANFNSYPQPDASIEQNPSWWEPGNRISIVAGKYKGREGICVRVTETKKSIFVDVEGLGEVRVLMKSARPFLNSKASERHDSSHPVSGTKSNNMPCTYSVGDEVWISGGKYRGKIGTVEKVCPKTLKVSFDETIGTIKHDYIKPIHSIPEYESKKNDFHMPEYNSGGMKFGDHTVSKILVPANEYELQNNSFIKHLAGRRLITLQRKVNSSKPIQEIITDSSGTYELISRKIVKSDDGGFFKPKEDRFEYIQTEGPGLTKVSAAEVFSTLANFAALPTRKVVARLDLLFSPIYKCKTTGEHLLKIFHSSSFEDIKEEGHVGCGFICEELLCDLLGNNAMAKRAICIQIRAIVPSKGIYKGMLMRKRIASGARLQLPSSMKKVPASTSEIISENGCLLVTQAGVDPSPANVNTGKLPTISVNGELLPDSFCPKELSKMLLRLFKTLKVPENIVREYAKLSTRRKGEKRIPLTNHSFLRGVADPTGKIPPNTVYLTGIQNTIALNEFIFITRSPCMKADDGRLVKVLREKPESMSVADFDWLNSLSFGVVIFGFPKEGFMPIPEQIADGDLDGDRYFCCWDQSILECIKAKFVTDIPSSEEVSEKLVEDRDKNNMDSDWFQQAQQFMLSPRVAEMPQLIPCLFKLSNEAADRDTEKFMRNADAEAFADALKQAIDNVKHGTNVTLPRHLWEKVPLKLHKYLMEA
jgi:RNA dependent RNA polymerase.